MALTCRMNFVIKRLYYWFIRLNRNLTAWRKINTQMLLTKIFFKTYSILIFLSSYVSFSFIKKKKSNKKMFWFFVIYLFLKRQQIIVLLFFLICQISLCFTTKKNEYIVQIRPVWKSLWWTHLKPLMSESIPC